MGGTITEPTGLPVIVYIIAAIVLIIINWIIAKKFEEVAFMKGHFNVHAFAVCFFLGIIGYVYVVALPDRGKPNPVKSAQPKQQNTPYPAASASFNIKSAQPKQQNTSYPAASASFNKYECKAVTVTDKTTSGRCMICKEYSENLKYCNIVKNTIGTEAPVCDSCIEKLKSNASW